MRRNTNQQQSHKLETKQYPTPQRGLQQATNNVYAGYMKKQVLYSIQQIAKKLDIPQSTVAYYRKNYADFMPHTRLKGKRYPMYEEQTIEAVSLIRDMALKNKEQHEILEVLESKYPAVIDKSDENTTNEQQTNEQPTTILATTQKQGEIISRLIGQQTELIRAQDTTLEAYKSLLLEKEEEINRLKSKLAEPVKHDIQHRVGTDHKQRPKTPKKASTKGFWGRIFS